MKRLATALSTAQKLSTNARNAITTNLSFLLTLTKMYLSVGFVIIGAAALGALLGLLVPILNYRDGTKYSAGKIWKDLMISLLREAWRETIRQSIYRKNS